MVVAAHAVLARRVRPVPAVLVRVPMARRVARVWPCEPATCQRARQLVARKLAAWGAEQGRTGVDEALAVAELLVSELVGNAIQHTGCVRLGLEVQVRDGLVRLSVVDCSRELPVVIQASDEDDHGRGLALVERLSTRWGVEVLPRGKSVWCEIQLGRPQRPPRTTSSAATRRATPSNGS